jgi:pyridinium-3,5-biscarboxylic acid mononucleotide sulfurtransferase
MTDATLAEERFNAAAIPAPLRPQLRQKWAALITELGSLPSAVIAYSGGVDSSFLAFAAAQALGDKMMAVTIQSPVDMPEAFQAAADFAAQHRFRHEIIFHDPLQDATFRSNPPDRCYHCKTSILGDLWDYARRHGYQAVLEGQNADDQADYRPGSRAVVETGTLSPLAHNGFTKGEIRLLAKAFNLVIWDKPSSPCLATRIPYGTEITAGALDQIARAERYLHDKGFRIVRVRYHADLARIEVEPERIPDLVTLRDDIVAQFKEIGFHYIALDLQGYRLGSMNEGLPL